ncbi:MAG TPA: hypothetical protein QGG18_05425 [Rhodospirillales bacterium]|nr:hypothetical protein [Rhodospirillales bacterium]
MKELAKSTYSLTISHVKQGFGGLGCDKEKEVFGMPCTLMNPFGRTGRIGILAIGILFILLQVSGVSTARAEVVKPEDFFNLDYAKTVWTEKTTRDDLQELTARCGPDTPYGVWGVAFEKSEAEARKALKTNPDRTLIEQCYDARLTYVKWNKIYDGWRKPLAVHGGNGWNKNTRAIACMAIQTANIFTGKCNDMPDWRHPVNVREDETDMAEGNTRFGGKRKKH